MPEEGVEVFGRQGAEDPAWSEEDDGVDQIGVVGCERDADCSAEREAD